MTEINIFQPESS